MAQSKDLVAASATPMVLAILSRGESYGYAIVQEIREVSEHQIEWKDGMLYPLLRRLEKQAVLAGGGLHPGAVGRLTEARRLARKARRSWFFRGRLTQSALDQLTQARALLVVTPES